MRTNESRRLIPGWLRPWLLRAWPALAVIAVASCSTMQPVDVGAAMRGAPPPGVDFGSLVEVRTLDGVKDTFRVTEMNAGGLGGSSGFYWYDDMQSLEVQRPGGYDENATAIILGVLGLAGLVWLVGNADSVRICSGTPCGSPPP